MSMTAAWRRLHLLGDERGSILVVAGLIAAVFVLLGTVIFEVGHTMAHRRHLQVQADAAALAAGQEFPLCTTNPGGAYAAMSTIANKYGGFAGSGAFNQQVGTGSGYAGNITSAYQSRTYPAGSHAQDPDNIFTGNTQTMTCGDPSIPDSPKFFDVKATETGIHTVFNFGISTTVNAHARVELKAVNELNGLLPLGVPDARPRYVFAKFIAESGTVTCTDQNDVPVPSCEEELQKPTPPAGIIGNQQQWLPVSPLKVTIPIGDLGVRIRLVGGSDPNAQCGTLYVECYDASSADGLIHIRGWNPAAAAPVVKDASLSSGTCLPDAYFATADCSAGISADIDLGAAVNANTQVWATVDGGNTKYQLATNPMSGTGVHTWSLAQGIPITGGGPHTIDLRFSINGTGNGTPLGTVQRAFEAAPDSSGPLFLVQVRDSGATPPSVFGPYSYQGGTTHTLSVTVNTQGSLLLSGPNDPSIYLRVFNDSGSASQNQTIDCDPALNNLQSEIETGCSPTYKTQTALTCPFANKNTLWASPQPWTCAAIGTGAAVGQIEHGFNQRIFGAQNPNGNACGAHPVNWIKPQNADPNATPPVLAGFDETAHPDDRRVVDLFVTPLGSFQGTGSGVVPVLDFGFFYVTGYKGDPCEGRDPNQDPVPNNRGSYVRGHFIKFFPIDAKNTSDDNCDLTTITPCLGVLTR
jgi:Flp pilus assembly protein TadG